MLRKTYLIVGVLILSAAYERIAMGAFSPVIKEVSEMPEKVRPGAAVEYAIKFKNMGSDTAAREYKVFVHFEHPGKSCDHIVFQGDHNPTLPTTLWETGKLVADGPHVAQVPTEAP